MGTARALVFIVHLIFRVKIMDFFLSRISWLIHFPNPLNFTLYLCFAPAYKHSLDATHAAESMVLSLLANDSDVHQNFDSQIFCYCSNAWHVSIRELTSIFYLRSLTCFYFHALLSLFSIHLDLRCPSATVWNCTTCCCSII